MTFAWPSWMEDAACARSPEDVWTLDDPDPESLAMARKVCSLCPVREQCRDFAVADPSLLGVWGGTIDDERAGMRPAVDPVAQVRFPIEPLAQMAGITLHQVGGDQPGQGRRGLAAVADLVGVTHRWTRSLAHIGLDVWQADRAAAALDLQAWLVWPEWAAVADAAVAEAIEREEREDQLNQQRQERQQQRAEGRRQRSARKQARQAYGAFLAGLRGEWTVEDWAELVDTEPEHWEAVEAGRGRWPTRSTVRSCVGLVMPADRAELVLEVLDELRSIAVGRDAGEPGSHPEAKVSA